MNLEPKIYLPYFPHLEHKLQAIAKIHDLTPIFIPSHKLNIFSLGEDTINKLEKANCIHKIDCRDYDSTYIDQTKRYLRERVKEHSRDVRNVNERSALAMHSSSHQHTIDFENIEILDIERNKKDREFLEMIYIHFHTNTINRTQDTMYLKNAYKSLIDKMKVLRLK